MHLVDKWAGKPLERRDRFFFFEEAASLWVFSMVADGWRPYKDIEPSGPGFRAFVERPRLEVRRPR